MNVNLPVYDLFGKTMPPPTQKPVLRKGVYGVIRDTDKVLLVEINITKGLWFPGGAVESNEDEHQALTREVHEETGLQIKIQPEIFFTSPSYLLYSALNKDIVFLCQNNYYLCSVVGGTLSDQHEVADGTASNPHWASFDSLQEQLFHPVARPVIQKLRKESV